MGQFIRLVNGIPRMQAESTSITIYDETYIVGVGGLTTGTPLALPNGQTYTGAELNIFLNGQRLEDVLDYNWVGSAPRNSVSFNFDLVNGDNVAFRIDRAP